jgi:hypothetical protein
MHPAPPSLTSPRHSRHRYSRLRNANQCSPRGPRSRVLAQVTGQLLRPKPPLLQQPRVSCRSPGRHSNNQHSYQTRIGLSVPRCVICIAATSVMRTGGGIVRWRCLGWLEGEDDARRGMRVRPEMSVAAGPSREACALPPDLLVLGGLGGLRRAINGAASVAWLHSRQYREHGVTRDADNVRDGH